MISAERRICFITKHRNKAKNFLYLLWKELTTSSELFHIHLIHWDVKLWVLKSSFRVNLRVDKKGIISKWKGFIKVSKSQTENRSDKSQIFIFGLFLKGNFLYAFWITFPAYGGMFSDNNTIKGKIVIFWTTYPYVILKCSLTLSFEEKNDPPLCKKKKNGSKLNQVRKINQWYFVTKILLPYCKKKWSSAEKNLWN